MNAISHAEKSTPFFDPTILTKAIQGTTLDVSLLKSGPFKGELTHTSLPNIWIDTAKYSSVVHSVGSIPEDRYLIGIRRENFVPIKNSGLSWISQQVAFFKPGDQLSLLSSSGSNALGLSFKRDFFEQKILALVEPITLTQLNQPLLASNHHLIQKLNKTIDTVLHLGKIGILNQLPQASLMNIEESLASLFADIWHSKKPNDRQRKVPNSFSLAQNIRDYMLDHVCEKISLSDICSEFNVSKRALHSIFAREFGISPIKYLNLIRLNSVHKQLLQADPTQITITEIALNSGFWHLGNFSAYYKKLYGESPSKTLQRTE